MTGQTSQRQELPTYQVGIFALVQKRDSILLVRPHRLLLPGGPQSLPGLLMQTTNTGMGVVETALRRTLLSQVGISVSELRLVGSHIARTGSERDPISRLNMIFSTEYNSGILNPQPQELKTAIWIPLVQLEGQVPEWLRSAIQEMQNGQVGHGHQPSAGSISLFGRRRQQD